MKNFAEMTPEQLAAYRESVAVLNDQMRAKLDSPAPNIWVMTQGILGMVDSDPATAVARQIGANGHRRRLLGFQRGQQPERRTRFR